MTSDDLPIHFFTIVLNGEPFIEYHIRVFQQLSFRWHWHIVEGVADLKHDTAWSLSSGGRVDDSLHHRGRSNDGTTPYLDQLSLSYPNQVTIYRQPEDQFWDGKREMVNAPLRKINEECLLWQIDVDELWTVEQIQKTRQLFIEQPSKTAAFFWCWYFVGEGLIISSRNCYSQNPQQEWLRTWHFRPGMFWAKHEPPVLVDFQGDHHLVDVAKIDPILHGVTELNGLVFQHYAYVMTEQLLFKERYYGYQNALSQWQRLQSENHFPVFLRDYFAWVTDDTVVDRADDFQVVPIVYRDVTTRDWQFRDSSELLRLAKLTAPLTPKIALDAVFFQVLTSGIGRVWLSLIKEWVKSGFAKNLVILDRARTAPKIPGIRYRLISAYDECLSGKDSQMLQEICQQEQVDLFVSTYYTAPTTTPTAILVYDMIPEVMQADSTSPAWREKHFAILHAVAHLAISKNTESDLLKYFPHISPDSTKVAYCAVSSEFYPADQLLVDNFIKSHGIDPAYFLVVGDRFGFNGYKNVKHFFEAFRKLPDHQKMDIVCVGGRAELEPELLSLVPRKQIHHLKLSDQELAIAYSGAVALVYPSRYEGFGMPVLEAMACGCPVITCRNSSLPEVANDAALYVSEDNIEELVQALVIVQNPDTRAAMIAAGLQQSTKFSWKETAQIVAKVLLETSARLKNDPVAQPPQVWTELRKIQSELQQLKYSNFAPQGQEANYTPGTDHLLRELQFLQSKIAAIESTKFWKLRALSMFLKKLRRSSLVEEEVRIDPEQSLEIQLLQARTKINWMQTSKFWKLRGSWLEFKKSFGLSVQELQD
jgi:glycosyltransferase involved in cell wall biosynthesis